MSQLAERPVFPPKSPGDLRALEQAAAAPEGTHAALVTPDGTTLRLPDAVFDVLLQVFAAMRAGRAVHVAPLRQQLTTQEAADLLGISRPTLIKLLDAGEIPYETPSRHRRIMLADLLAYKERRRAEQDAALDELTSLTEDMGLYELDGPDRSAQDS